MKRRAMTNLISRAVLGYTIAIVALLLAFAQPAGSSAAPGLQLPWPVGTSHNISGGYSYNCGGHTGANQYGIDFGFPVPGSSVAASAAGTVVIAATGYNGGAGNYIEVDHGGGFRSRYLHLQDANPWPSYIYPTATVGQGLLIGYSGNTGLSTGPHLHFDLKWNGNASKPEPMSGVTGFGQYGVCGIDSPSWTATGSSWQSWESWGAYADGSPIAIAYDDARPDFIWEVKRSGSDIFVRRWNPGWTSWQNISNLVGDPNFNGTVAISNHEGTVRVVAQSSSMVYLKQWISGNSWYNWSDVSQGSPVPGAIAIANGPNGRIDIVGVASNKMWIKWYEGGNWYGWQDLSGASPITGAVAVANRGGMTHVVGWAGGHAWLKWKIGATWYGWQDLVSPVDNTFLAIDNTNALTSGDIVNSPRRSHCGPSRRKYVGSVLGYRLCPWLEPPELSRRGSCGDHKRYI